MAKQPKKKTKPVVTKPVVIKPDVVQVVPSTSWSKYIPYAITLFYFILSFIGTLNHEMWRDEYQAWMVAADAHSIPELFKNLKYEGNPVLWHAFLFIITTFTEDPFWMQVFHILISTASIYLIHRYSPLPIIQKVLLTFGYYTFFEYNLISRSYGLGLLLVVIFCVLYEKRQKYILWIAVVLFLLSNVTIFGVMLAVCFAGIIIWERIFTDKKSKVPPVSWDRLGLFTGIVAAGVFAGYLQIRPEPDNSFPQMYVTYYDIIRAQFTFSRMIQAYFPIPDFRTLHFWNSNILVPSGFQNMLWSAPVLYFLWVLAFLRYRLILLLYAGGTLLLIVFFYYTGNLWSRYAGHLLVLLMACCWLLHDHKEQPFKNALINKFSLLTDRIRVPLFILILSVNAYGGIRAYLKDLKHPFSNSPKAAAFIKENQLDQYHIIGSRDYIASPLAVQLRKKIWYAERHEFGSFIKYDQRRLNLFSFNDVQSTISELNKNGANRIILVISSPVQKTDQVTGESEPWLEGKISEDLNMKLLTSIPGGIVLDEQYHIYSIDAIGGQ